MGKPTGFMDYERQNSTTIAPEERLKILMNSIFL